MTRPHGKKGDTGWEWAGMHRSAAESLMWASRDDDPRCVVVGSQECILAAREALKLAKNQRQIDMTSELLDAAHKTKSRGEQFLKGEGVMGDELG